MYAKTGYEETISLVSLLAAPGSSLSELISASVSCLNWSFFIAKITSSFLGGTCSFVSLSFYFDGKKRVRFSGILSEVLFHWWLLVIINDHSKTNFYLSSSLKKWYFTLKCLDIQSKLFNKVISVVRSEDFEFHHFNISIIDFRYNLRFHMIQSRLIELLVLYSFLF